jgi:hypothetical protein
MTGRLLELYLKKGGNLRLHTLRIKLTQKDTLGFTCFMDEPENNDSASLTQDQWRAAPNLRVLHEHEGSLVSLRQLVKFWGFTKQRRYTPLG